MKNIKKLYFYININKEVIYGRLIKLYILSLFFENILLYYFKIE